MNERRKKIIRENASRGGKNGSREDKSRAGRLGYQKMMEALERKAEIKEQQEQIAAALTAPHSTDDIILEEIIDKPKAV